MAPFAATARVRHALATKPNLKKINCGRYSQKYVSMSDTDKDRLEDARERLAPIISRLHMDDAYHRQAIDDLFSSELVFRMTNNISFYVSYNLLPFAVRFNAAPPRRDRTTLADIDAYVTRFKTSSKLLRHILVIELEQLRNAGMLDVREMFVLNPGTPVARLKLDDLLRAWRALADDAPLPQGLPLGAEPIISAAFIELYYALRTPLLRFSIAASTDHKQSITTLAFDAPTYLARIRAKAKRMDADGRVRPSAVEYVSIIATVLLSLALGVGAGVANWAERENVLERVFDGVGVFSLSSALTVTLASRRLDLYDLIFLLFGKARFLSGYLEMLSVLGVNDRQLKLALTFPDVCVPPLASSSTCYAYEKHDGLLDTILGLSSNDEDANVIIGSTDAVMRTADGGMRHFSIEQRQLVHHMVPDDEARFRIVVPADHVFVK